MANDPFAQTRAINSVQNRSVGQYNSYAGVNTSRQDRFQARQLRRWGDWDGYLGVPTPLLWLEGPLVFSPFEEVLFVEPTFIDIWD